MSDLWPENAQVTVSTEEVKVRDWLDKYARHLVGTKQEQELINAIKGQVVLS